MQRWVNFDFTSSDAFLKQLPETRHSDVCGSFFIMEQNSQN